MEYLEKLKQIANENHIPIIKDDGCDFLINFCREHNPQNILEIGTAVGYSGSFMLKNTTNSHLTTIEINQDSYNQAQNTFQKLELTDRVTQVLGDAKEVIKQLDCQFDLIFLDGPKGQYLAYMEDLIRLTKNGGYIIADNIYFHGLVNGPEFVKHKLRAMVVNLRKFIQFVKTDSRLTTNLYDIADGISVSKINK
jgi:predicted O-methyltransferase YrrM